MSVVDESIRVGKVSSTALFSGRSNAQPFMSNNYRRRKNEDQPVTCDQLISQKTNAAQASHLDRIGFALRSVTLVHARGMGESISHALREALSLMHSADRHLRSTLPRSICNTTVAGSQSCRGAGLVRRPQRPGNQSRAEARSQWIPPGNSPSRITGHRRLCRNALAGHAEHLA